MGHKGTLIFFLRFTSIVTPLAQSKKLLRAEWENRN